ncbi:MAG: hypothetical protein R3C61_10580 [Bacteroidia bacterium]
MNLRTVNAYFLAFGLAAMIFLSACSDPISAHSPIFKILFTDDSTAFRGISIGEQMREVRKKELPLDPEHDDKLGVSYLVPIDSATEMLIDYYSDNIRNERSQERVASIVANISLNDEVKTAQLYSEIQDYFNKNYGIYSGSYGDYSWNAGTRLTPEMEVRLLLAENKKGITLNFVNTRPEYLADSVAFPVFNDTLPGHVNSE